MGNQSKMPWNEAGAVAERNRFIRDCLAGCVGGTLSAARWRTVGCSGFWPTAWQRWRTGHLCDGKPMVRVQRGWSRRVDERRGLAAGGTDTVLVWSVKDSCHPPPSNVWGHSVPDLESRQLRGRHASASRTGARGPYLLPMLYPKNSSGSSGTRTQRTFVAFSGSRTAPSTA